MKTFFIVFSFIVCSNCDNYQTYKKEIKLLCNGDVLMGNILIQYKIKLVYNGDVLMANILTRYAHERLFMATVQ